MFLRATKRFKDDKVHDYWSMVENVRNWGEAWLGRDRWDKLGLELCDKPGRGGFGREVSDTPRHVWGADEPQTDADSLR